MSRKDRQPIRNTPNQEPTSALDSWKWQAAIGGTLVVGAIGTVGTIKCINSQDTVKTPVPITRSENGSAIPKPTIVFPDTDQRKETDEDIIKKEILRLNITPEQREREMNLWSKGYSVSPNKLPITNETIGIARKRVTDTLALMNQSENPYIKTAKEFVDKEHIMLEVYPNLGTAGLLSSLREQNGKVQFLILVSANGVMNQTNAVMLAAGIAHEAEHLRTMVQQFTQLPPKQRVEKIIQFSQNWKNLLYEEARGYAVESNTLLYAMGLGFTPSQDAFPPQFYVERQVALFIKSGRNPTDSKWRAYISNMLKKGGYGK